MTSWRCDFCNQVNDGARLQCPHSLGSRSEKKYSHPYMGGTPAWSPAAIQYNLTFVEGGEVYDERPPITRHEIIMQNIKELEQAGII